MMISYGAGLSWRLEGNLVVRSDPGDVDVPVLPGGPGQMYYLSKTVNQFCVGLIRWAASYSDWAEMMAGEVREIRGGVNQPTNQ